MLEFSNFPLLVLQSFLNEGLYYPEQLLKKEGGVVEVIEIMVETSTETIEGTAAAAKSIGGVAELL
jgi:hypothetical protein